ncbi:zinc finger protein ZAT9-like [Typha angustifolia]|uniref:zinc finger protein ZAT9-like n=1 Tax=Typha angustifolia TaxID=59011 RepID=UPI003C3056F9
MEGDQELTHDCKVCGKSFPCGRSLGGHMRSHLSSMNPSSELEQRMQRAGYGLRENPKKTSRLSDFDGDGERRDKLCRVCGKGFSSWKSLFGHMSCHSWRSNLTWEEEEEVVVEEEEGEVQEERQESSESLLGSEFIAMRRRRRSRRVASIPAASSSLSELEKEQEDVALSLMMLSRDIGFWGENCLVLEDKGSWKEDTDEKGSEECLPRIGLKKVNSDKNDNFKEPKANSSNVDELEHSDEASCLNPFKEKTPNPTLARKRRTNGGDLGQTIAKRSRFTCSRCNKSFHSYQALGGHRASQKRMNGCCVAKTDEHSFETDASFESRPVEEMVNKSRNVKEHECSICYKVFSSGQALGGHKRSHLVASNQSLIAQQPSPTIPDLIDLNLPAPMDEDSSNTIETDECKQWWIRSSREVHEQVVVGLMTN